jgi:hypothetical protein
MTKRYHKDWLSAFIKYASFGEAPLKMYWWVGVSTIAGALRRRVWMDMKSFQWVPNFYIVLVAPPGVVSKSTTASIGMNLLRQVPGVNFGPDAVTWQKLIEDMGKANEMVLWPETGEYLPMSCVTISASEFGNFLKTQDRDMVDALVHLWDGQAGAFKKATKSSGCDQIENPWVNIIACTTPAWIADNFPDYMVGGGFASRSVFVYADTKRQLVAYPDQAAPAEYETRRKELIHDLELIATMVGEYTLDDDAREWGELWYDNHNKAGHQNLDSNQFGGYLARKQTHIHKLAMVIAASQSNHLVIEKHHLQLASDMIDGIEKDMPKIYDRVGRTQQTQSLAELCDAVNRSSPIDLPTLYRKMSRRCTLEEFNKILASAVAAGFVTQTNVGGTLVLRRGVANV